MIEPTEEERQRAFAMWLRTGRLPAARGPDGIEYKFNPWHDPKDGRFTFAGAGRYFGRGATGSIAPAGPRQLDASTQPRASRMTGAPKRPTNRQRKQEHAAGGWGDGFTGGGGGDFGGDGATGTWEWAVETDKASNFRIIDRRAS